MTLTQIGCGAPLSAERTNDHWHETARLPVDRELLLKDIKNAIAPD